MSNVYNHRPMVPASVPSRLTELLDAIKQEFDSMNQDTSVFRAQRDEYDNKSK